MTRDINFNVVNDYDKNLSALAYVKAKCLFNLHGRNTCSPTQCEMCDVQQGFDSCMGELPVCDRLRVMTQADDIFAGMQQRHMYYTRWRKATPVAAIERAAFGIKMFIGMFAMLMGVVLLIMAFAKMSAYNTLKSTTVSKYILPVLDNVEGNIRDTNGDGWPDTNIDLDGDGVADTNYTTESDCTAAEGEWVETTDSSDIADYSAYEFVKLSNLTTATAGKCSDTQYTTQATCEGANETWTPASTTTITFSATLQASIVTTTGIQAN